MDDKERQINNWLLKLDELEITEALEHMEMQSKAEYVEKLARLSKWLRGNYSATDFEPNDSVDK